MVRILWIEDEGTRISGLVRPLLRDGHEVTVAGDQKRAEEILRSGEQFGLIILDILIPTGIDEVGELHDYPGLDLLKSIRKDMQIEVPIVVLTVVNDALVLNELGKYSVQRTLIKGRCLPSVLKTQVYEVLGIEETE